MKPAPVMAALAALLLLPACDNPRNTLQLLQKDVADYASAPTNEAAAKIDENFARLDHQIAKLHDTGKNAEADSLAKQRDILQAQFLAARMTSSLLKAKEAAAGIGEAFRKAGEAFGKALHTAPGDTN